MTNWFDAEDHACHALEMLERGRWAEAEIGLRKALSIHPDQPEWLFNLGIILESSGRDRQARDLFERAAALAPEEVDLAGSAAMVCARLGDRDKALHWLDKVLVIDPENEDALARKIEILVAQGRHDEAETAFYLAEMTLDGPSSLCLLEIAVSLIARGQFRKAGWCLREAMKMDPGLPRIRLRLAEVHASTGRLDRAIQLCGREVREDPANLEALSLYAELLETAGQRTESVEVRRRILDFEPGDVRTREGLARLLMQCEEHERALVEWKMVRKLDPDLPGVDLALGRVELELGLDSEARVSLLRAHERCCDLLDRQPVAPEYLKGLARLMLQAHLAAEAVVIMEAACEANADDEDALRLLALSRYRSGDQRGGMMVSRKVLRKDPNCLSSIHNLAFGALQRKRYRIASAWIKRGLRISQGDEGLRRIRLRLWLSRLGIKPIGWIASVLKGRD